MKPELKPIDQQVVVVTGASSGIGLVTARKAAALGARVLLVARSGEALRGIVGEITVDGGVADSFVADVGEWEQVRAAAAHAVQRFGRIDTWVNNAGVTIYAKLTETPGDEHERLFRTNYFGTVHGCLAALPHLAHGGAIVTVGSVGANMPTPLMGAYAASKHAVRGYVDSLRVELEQDASPVSLSLVMPSGIDTPIAEHAANHVGGEARVPPPVYDPALVAEAILHCATNRRREMAVGGAGVAQTLLAAHAPPLFDALAAPASATFIDPTREQPVPDNLFAPVRAGQERSRHQSGRRVSLYSAATRRPGIASLSVGVLVGAAVLAWRR